MNYLSEQPSRPKRPKVWIPKQLGQLHNVVSYSQSGLRMKYTLFTDHSVAEKDLDEEEGDTRTSVSRPPKADSIGELSSCENCRKKHTRCSRARPRCRRCKQDKEKCIYSQELCGDAEDPPRKLLPGHACSACGRKGLKCDGKLPECGNCKDRKVECLYTGRGLKKLAKAEQLVLL